ncbi:MAG TPA: hypothetical protein VG099_05150 [Gemmataceae bacterium]|jgi:hypothetical protein|nr:hypothetical protein [Gemmataceae bacterium]
MSKRIVLIEPKQDSGKPLTLRALSALALPCFNWRHRFFYKRPAQQNIAELFRSRELEPVARRVFPASCHTAYGKTLVNAFAQFLVSRRNLTQSKFIQEEEARKELLRPQALLLTNWQLSLFDGALTPETDGFLDDGAMPPWDTWIALVRVGRGKSQSCLLSWVPRWLSEKVNFAIQVDAAECLSWLVVSQGNHFSVSGWGKPWQKDSAKSLIG